MGYTSRGKFRGFKLHSAMNQQGLPLRAIVTPGYRFDGPFLPELIEDLEADYVLADGATCSRHNSKAVRDMSAVPVIAANPRKKGKSSKVESDVLLKTERYVVEQFNWHLKGNVSGECWLWPRGLVKKVTMVMTGLICYNAEAMRSPVAGDESQNV